MPVPVSGTAYYTATELVGISRQSLWHWRREDFVFCGHRRRGRELVYTRGRMDVIYAHTHRLERAGTAENRVLQLDLFTLPASGPKVSSA